jgi:hypothetical protein
MSKHANKRSRSGASSYARGGEDMDRLNQVDFQGATGYGVHDILEYRGKAIPSINPQKISIGERSKVIARDERPNNKSPPLRHYSFRESVEDYACQI